MLHRRWLSCGAALLLLLGPSCARITLHEPPPREDVTSPAADVSTDTQPADAGHDDAWSPNADAAIDQAQPAADRSVDAVAADGSVDAGLPDSTTDGKSVDTTADSVAPDSTVDTLASDSTVDTLASDSTVDTLASDSTVDIFMPDSTVDTIAPDATVDTIAPDTSVDGGAGTCSILFITSDVYRPGVDFQSITDADALCASVAKKAKLAGNFMALISDATVHAATRFTLGYPVLTTNGDVITDTDLFAGTGIQNLIRDESGALSSLRAWTGSDVLGLGGAGVTVNCDSWTKWNTSYRARTGNASVTTVSWLGHTGGGLLCDNSAALYCISVP